MDVRPATPDDAEAIAAIFAQGIEDRVATFETIPAPAEEWERRVSPGGELILVAEGDGRVVAFAVAGPYSDSHHYYAGVSEATMYVERGSRRRGIGLMLLNALAEAAEERGQYKLVGKIFTTNEPSIALVRACGFREVGVHRRHGRLDGRWKDVLVVERLLGGRLLGREKIPRAMADEQEYTDPQRPRHREHRVRTPTGELSHEARLRRQQTHITWFTLVLLAVLAMLAYAAAFDLDHWAEWIVFGGICATAVGFMIAVHSR